MEYLPHAPLRTLPDQFRLYFLHMGVRVVLLTVTTTRDLERSGAPIK